MINVIERQATLGRSLYEINTNTLRELATLQRENVEKYFEANRAFGGRLPEIRSISDFVALQRAYGESLWTNVKVAVETQNQIVRSAFEDTASAVKAAFTVETEEAPKATKAKAKAKKPATEAV